MPEKSACTNYTASELSLSVCSDELAANVKSTLQSCSSKCKQMLSKYKRSCMLAASSMKMQISGLDKACSQACIKPSIPTEAFGMCGSEFAALADGEGTMCGVSCKEVMRKFVGTCDYQKKTGVGAHEMFQRLGKICCGDEDGEGDDDDDGGK